MLVQIGINEVASIRLLTEFDLISTLHISSN